ncbi:NADH:flavin oxidoreductase [Phytohalomonas tamaricis]|uniref:NADH:flavin oxidoreductase n=1 Tax=Phytohalomonas tamaricis TaxID=2081032 RepID=UPI000D0B145F|nr:NADH:flavin oxidoreductase [Phytohalomonas tamaricis]
MATTIHPRVASLFTPITLGSLTLANRLVMAPMTRQHSPGGVPNEEVARYYRRRAEGGIGLIITEGTYIDHPAANGYENAPDFFGEQALAGWKRVVDEVHAAGAKIIPQLWHVGNERRPGMPHDLSVPGYGPMTIEEEGQVVVKGMSIDDIYDVIASYARAARDAERLGFDGLEIHAAHGYLLDTFLWSQTNQRDDEYGGSLENRLRLPVEVVRAMRAEVSDDFPIVLRFSQWKMSDYEAKIAETPDELGTILSALAEAGVDIFHASTRRFWEPAFEGSPDNLATWARELTGKPAITVGSIGLDKAFGPDQFTGKADPNAGRADIDTLIERMDAGAFDLVAVGRALLSDPDWPAKIRAGRFEDTIDFDRNALSNLVI